MTVPTVIVYNPIPHDLHRLLVDAGYQPSTATSNTTTFTHPEHQTPSDTLNQASVRAPSPPARSRASDNTAGRTARRTANRMDGRVEAPVGKLMLTPNELAGALGISRSGLYVLMAKGHIRSVRIGGARRIPTDEVNRYIQTLKQDAETLQGVN